MPVEQFAFADNQLAYANSVLEETPPASQLRAFKSPRIMPNVSHRLGGPLDDRRAA
jgi:hypothetical protein